MSEELFAAARAAMARSYAPYSQFPVGAALRTEEGRIFSGCNVENASFPEGWCAETTALAHYVMGGGGRITDIAVVAEKMPRITPCGGCRQRLAEFAAPDAKVHLCDDSGILETVMLGALLPLGFGGASLK